jgi:hypothetical protein
MNDTVTNVGKHFQQQVAMTGTSQPLAREVHFCLACVHSATARTTYSAFHNHVSPSLAAFQARRSLPYTLDYLLLFGQWNFQTYGYEQATCVATAMAGWLVEGKEPALDTSCTQSHQPTALLCSSPAKFIKWPTSAAPLQTPRTSSRMVPVRNTQLMWGPKFQVNMIKQQMRTLHETH